MSSRAWWVVGAIVAVTVAAVLLWPAPDPLANVDTVAIRVGNEPSATESFDLHTQLELVLGGRNIHVVSDEGAADLVLSLDDFRVNLGDIQISLTDGNLQGKASAACIVTDVHTGKTHTMDFTVQLENGDVRAELIGRKFWQFWK